MTIERTVHLTRHPAADDAPVASIEVRVRRSPEGELELLFRLEGDLARLRIPAFASPRMGSHLWEHTCFEAFIAPEGGTAYHELNFSPSGEWAAFAFRAYRDGGPLQDESLAPGIRVERSRNVLELEAMVSPNHLSPLGRDRRQAPGEREGEATILRLGLTAVVETDQGGLSYWALRHATERPDFHHADSFALRLEALRP